eukprot:gnl/MRDRNA2_/MRDRNA2_90510_c0_seq1.p1 gnl/MRDRNA2_/MRDRNA2_90510_c0~~gnl/MRDRNA2_/MRDRNA2_90510_c0_seq1.p1  ORF type:complete len:108 (+),score=26.27 gnl/MRDRNA2_/MRDRNA2_90510_c0_seq1:75-398(+)
MKAVAVLLFVSSAGMVQSALKRAMPSGPAAINPCSRVPCPELVCPASAKVAEYPGHCCPYCEVDKSLIKDTTDYSGAALDAFNSYATAEYAGGYKSGKFKNKINAGK